MLANLQKNKLLQAWNSQWKAFLIEEWASGLDLDCFKTIFCDATKVEICEITFSPCLYWSAQHSWGGWLIAESCFTTSAVVLGFAVLGALSQSCLEKALSFWKLVFRRDCKGRLWLDCLVQLCLCSGLGGNSHFSSPEAKVCLVINVCGSCSICCQGLGRNLTSESCPGGGEGKNSRSCIPHSCEFTPAFCLAASYLSLLIVWSLSPSSAQTEWKRKRGNGGTAPCMHEKSQQERLRILRGRQGPKLLLSTTCTEGNKGDRDLVHRHKKSQGGVFPRVGAVEAAVLYTLGILKDEALCFSHLFCYSQFCLDTGKAELMRQIPNVLIHHCAEL